MERQIKDWNWYSMDLSNNESRTISKKNIRDDNAKILESSKSPIINMVEDINTVEDIKPIENAKSVESLSTN